MSPSLSQASIFTDLVPQPPNLIPWSMLVLLYCYNIRPQTSGTGLPNLPMRLRIQFLFYLFYFLPSQIQQVVAMYLVLYPISFFPDIFGCYIFEIHENGTLCSVLLTLGVGAVLKGGVPAARTKVNRAGSFLNFVFTSSHSIIETKIGKWGLYYIELYKD